MQAATITLTVGLVGWPGEQPRAQGFGFLFGQPERGYGSRYARRVRPRDATVPLPVARPRFPEDDAPAKAVVPPSPAAAPLPGPAASTPPSGKDTATAPRTPPLPPEKPADLVAPPDAKPSRPEPTKTPATDPKADIAKPTEPKVDSSKVNAPKPAASTAPGLKPPDTKAPPLPAVAPSGATNAFNPRQPSLDATCPGRLQAAQVDAASIQLGPQSDARCVVQQPVKLDHLTLPDGSKVSFPDRPTLACVTADTFASYVRDLLVPLAKGTYGVGLEAVWTGPGLECRSRDHIFGAKLSAHGQGLAIDIAQLKLVDGRVLSVGEPKSDRDQGFETAARAAGCGYFHTVLGPGSDSYHRTHWHFDLEERGSKGDGKFCK